MLGANAESRLREERNGDSGTLRPLIDTTIDFLFEIQKKNKRNPEKTKIKNDTYNTYKKLVELRKRGPAELDKNNKLRLNLFYKLEQRYLQAYREYIRKRNYPHPYGQFVFPENNRRSTSRPTSKSTPRNTPRNTPRPTSSPRKLRTR